MLFHSLKVKEFKPRFTILRKVLELRRSNNRDNMLGGIQKLVRTEKMLELQRFDLREAVHDSSLGNFHDAKKLG